MSGIAVVGAGPSGAAIARELSEAGFSVDVFESRPHVAGNCHTQRDPSTGVMVHVYGPHIFHTEDDEVWRYVTRFAEFGHYEHRVKTTTADAVYSMPINLHTLNQFFGKCLSPSSAREWIKSVAYSSHDAPRNFEEQALQLVGREIYETFLRGYTLKQWGRDPKILPASILQRLPVRFSYDDRYFSHKYQGIPIGGYTALFERMLDHPLIRVHTSTHFRRGDAQSFDYVFYSGAIDQWFESVIGVLGYRTLDFECFTAEGDWQGCSVMNYGDPDVPWTRITEHKHFAPWEEHDKTTVYKEFSRECCGADIPYYPIRLLGEKKMLTEYCSMAEREENVTFVGRLGTYRYLDMDVTIREAVDAARTYISRRAAGEDMPSFVKSPV